MYVDFSLTRQSRENWATQHDGNFSSSPCSPKTQAPSALHISYDPGESYLQDQSWQIIPCSSVACARRKAETTHSSVLGWGGAAYAAHVLFQEVSRITHLARGAMTGRHVSSQKPDTCLTRMSGGEVTGGSLNHAQ